MFILYQDDLNADKFHKVYNKIITAPDASESDRFDAFILKTAEHDRSEY